MSLGKWWGAGEEQEAGKWDDFRFMWREQQSQVICAPAQQAETDF